ncbi:hypothetical protein ElyMa_005305200 [Elysia marginata]|uniref:Uncharacterized protein n=1 Tax=Elysia marginata TaxID=1093978 RepID=A0AAV4JYK1_9GAST|nr:hypothetical protein ElyMa_005305200 [Elysia marginata]
MQADCSVAGRQSLHLFLIGQFWTALLLTESALAVSAVTRARVSRPTSRLGARRRLLLTPSGRPGTRALPRFLSTVTEAVHTPDASEIEDKPDEQHQPKIDDNQHMDASTVGNLSNIPGEEQPRLE